jgi:DNA-binding NtrC family response regulator
LFDFDSPEKLKGFLTEDKAVIDVLRYMESLSSGVSVISIVGESGSGKKMIGRALHGVGEFSGSFLTMDSASLDSSELICILFERQPGEYPRNENLQSSVEKKITTTLFLENIDMLNKKSQMILLQWLSDKYNYKRLNESFKCSNVKVIAATCQNLSDKVKEGCFNKALYGYLSVSQINLPPLRVRKHDIPLLLDYFIKQASRKIGRRIPVYPPTLPVLLANYDFPGNISELKSMVYNAVSLCRSHMLSMRPFHDAIDGAIRSAPDKAIVKSDKSVSFHPDLRLPSLAEMNDVLIEEALSRTGNNQSLAAKMLGISQPALSMRLKRSSKVSVKAASSKHERSCR